MCEPCLPCPTRASFAVASDTDEEAGRRKEKARPPGGAFGRVKLLSKAQNQPKLNHSKLKKKKRTGVSFECDAK